MKLPRLLPVIIFTAFSLLTAAISSASMNVVSPSERTFVENELVSVVLTVEKGSLDEIRISLNNRKNSVIRVPVKNEIVCRVIELKPGMNRILISGLKGDRMLEEKKIDLFYRFELSKKSKKIPPDFKRNYFHLPGKEKTCIPCHVMEPSEADKAPPKPEISTCYSCHKRITEYRFVHGPASVWACLSCHETTAGGRKYSVEKPDSKVCYSCHEDSLKLWDSKKFRHGPSMISCTICHNPHASDQPFWVHIHTTKLCVSCHEGKDSGTHVIAGFSSKGHPTRSRPDPLRPGREFTCAGCHNPHAGDTQNLLYYDNSKTQIFCTMCHQR